MLEAGQQDAHCNLGARVSAPCVSLKRSEEEAWAVSGCMCVCVWGGGGGGGFKAERGGPGFTWSAEADSSAAKRHQDSAVHDRPCIKASASAPATP